MSLFSIQDALVKLLAVDHSLLQILFVRSATVILPLFLFIYFKQGWDGFKTERKKEHGIRVFYNLMAFISYYFAITRLPLATATAIGLSTPLFLTALSGPLLGEPADLKRKGLLVVGFIGVLVVIQPDFERTDWLGVVAAIFGALMFAMLAIQNRKMSATEDTNVMVFYGVATFFIITGMSMTVLWEIPSPKSLMIMVGVGVNTFLAQYCIVHAYKYAAVYTIAPIEYVIILRALFFGWVLFREVPSWIMLLGCVVIVSSGLMLAFVEKVEHSNSHSDR
ncbi:MAG: EamA family transporter [Gammaproteobacteria bacterium]|nr:EamA family transporter [Gammaproteobacteria bacterium]